MNGIPLRSRRIILETDGYESKFFKRSYIKNDIAIWFLDLRFYCVLLIVLNFAFKNENRF